MLLISYIRVNLQKEIKYIIKSPLNSILGILFLLFIFSGIYNEDFSNIKTGEACNSYLNLIRYIAWSVMAINFSSISGRLSEEIIFGTFQQLYINSSSFIQLLLSIAVSALIISTAQIFLSILILTTSNIIPIGELQELVVTYLFFLLGIPSIWGIGLISASLTLRIKNINNLNTLIGVLLFAITIKLAFENVSIVQILPMGGVIYNLPLHTGGIDFFEILKILLNDAVYLILGIATILLGLKGGKNRQSLGGLA